MLQKNKKFLLVLLLLISTPTMPRNTVNVWISQICTHASQWTKIAISAIKEYNHATAALISIGLCTALFAVLAKKQKNQWQAIEQKYKDKKSELTQCKQEAQNCKEKITTLKASIKAEKTDRENLEKQFPLAEIDAKIKEEEELIHNHTKQQERCAALKKEITITEQQIQATHNEINLLNERNNPANVHRHLDYWLKHCAEPDNDDAPAAHSESKYGHEKGKYDK
jgi:septal ring factor EnvC (AmiA/AmiB activator)